MPHEVVSLNDYRKRRRLVVPTDDPLPQTPELPPPDPDLFFNRRWAKLRGFSIHGQQQFIHGEIVRLLHHQSREHTHHQEGKTPFETVTTTALLFQRNDLEDPILPTKLRDMLLSHYDYRIANQYRTYLDNDGKLHRWGQPKGRLFLQTSNHPSSTQSTIRLQVGRYYERVGGFAGLGICIRVNPFSESQPFTVSQALDAVLFQQRQHSSKLQVFLSETDPLDLVQKAVCFTDHCMQKEAAERFGWSDK